MKFIRKHYDKIQNNNIKFFREEMFWDWQGIKPIILELFSDIFGSDYFIFMNI